MKQFGIEYWIQTLNWINLGIRHVCGSGGREPEEVLASSREPNDIDCEPEPSRAEGQKTENGTAVSSGCKQGLMQPASSAFSWKCILLMQPASAFFWKAPPPEFWRKCILLKELLPLKFWLRAVFAQWGWLQLPFLGQTLIWSLGQQSNSGPTIVLSCSLFV